MTKSISPIWFLREPIDPEHKEYVLLDYLKEISKRLNKENCYPIMKEISRVVKILNEYRKDKAISESIKKSLGKGDRDYINSFVFDDLLPEQKETLDVIIEDSLETLYDYSEICLDILKEEESKIKIFRIQSKFDNEDNLVNSGIVIIRNMVTDKLLNYFFKSNVRMETPDGDKEVSILKKIHLKNSFFSLNYEYIYHEILNEINTDNKYSPKFYVVEIYENFEETSEIYKLAKEKFIEHIAPFENRGEEIGVTLSHPHGQIYAYSYVPPRVEKMLAAAIKYKQENGKVLFDEVVAREILDAERIVARNERWIAYVPYAALLPAP